MNGEAWTRMRKSLLKLSLRLLSCGKVCIAFSDRHLLTGLLPCNAVSTPAVSAAKAPTHTGGVTSLTRPRPPYPATNTPLPLSHS